MHLNRRVMLIEIRLSFFVKMTKEQEINQLALVIDSFGPDSYIGPWLRDNFEKIVADIRNDFPVSNIKMPMEANREAHFILTQAQLKAQEIENKARKTADEIRQNTEKKLRDMQEVFVNHVRWKLEQSAKDAANKMMDEIRSANIQVKAMI